MLPDSRLPTPSPQPHRTRVVKFGGSLFTLPNWHTALKSWFAAQPALPTLLVVGGGEVVEALRREDARFSYDQGLLHDLALRGMELNAEFVRARIPEIETCANLDAWKSRTAQDAACLLRALPHCPTIAIPQITTWWNDAAVRGAELPPATWATTSDTLAAWLACATAAEELVLLKSCLPADIDAAENDPTDWAARGFVDPAFPEWGSRVNTLRVETLA